MSTCICSFVQATPVQATPATCASDTHASQLCACRSLMVKPCGHCIDARAVLRRPKTGEQLCRECFFRALEDEVHTTIVTKGLFKPGQRVALGASGGKDSTVLIHMMTTLNQRHG